MTAIEGKPILRSLGANLAVFILLPLLLNGVIFWLGWDKQSADGSGQMQGIPPGWAVGAIWMALFTGMGVARWLLLERAPRWLAEGTSLLAFLCLLYPLYTSGLRNDHVGLIGNLLTAAVAIPLAAAIWRRSRVAAGCIAAICAWLLYAAAATAHGLYH